MTKGEFPLEPGLLPREYAVGVLDAAGGGLLQQEVVDRTGWSEPCVSRTLGRMEERDAVVRVRFGHENVVYLPDAASDAERERRRPHRLR